MKVKGWQGGVEFDGERVTVTRWLRGSTTIPARSLAGVEIMRAGIGFRAIRFNVAGGTIASRRRSPIGSYTRSLRDPYSVLFRSGRKAEFEQLRDQILG